MIKNKVSIMSERRIKEADLLKKKKKRNDKEFLTLEWTLKDMSQSVDDGNSILSVLNEMRTKAENSEVPLSQLTSEMHKVSLDLATLQIFTQWNKCYLPLR